MKKKIAIRKLNRTLLKKEGTKEVYITGKNVLIPFFDYDSIDQLATSRLDPASKRLFAAKGEKGKNSTNLTLSVTKENNEVRLTGFEEFFTENKVNEVDQIVMECNQTTTTKEYLLTYYKCLTTRVMQSYDTKDSADNYDVVTSESGSIQFTEKDTPTDVYDDTYWLWDDSFDEDRWNRLVGNALNVSMVGKNKVQSKVVLIEDTGVVIKKLLKAQSSSSRRVVFQNKKLYRIKELIDGKWEIADFGGIKNLEFTDEKERIKISNRDAMSFCYYEGGEVQ